MKRIYILYNILNKDFALILYKKEKYLWRQYKWIFESDEIIKGQWIKNNVLISHCDIRGDGNFFLYAIKDCRDALNPDKGKNKDPFIWNNDIYSVISKPLNFTAIDLQGKKAIFFSCSGQKEYDTPEMVYFTENIYNEITNINDISREILRPSFDGKFLTKRIDSYNKNIVLISDIKKNDNYKKWIDPLNREVHIETEPYKIFANNKLIFDFSNENFELIEPF